MNCSNCFYFVKDNSHGRCHLHPPMVMVLLAENPKLDSVHQIVTQMKVAADYPIIVEPDSDKSWCGDHRKKEH